MRNERPVLKTSAEIVRLSKPARAVGAVLYELRALIRPGLSLRKIEAFCEERLKYHGVQPGQLGYRGFPSAISISIGALAAHGVPNDALLSPGDVLTVDIVAEKDGWYADAAWSYVVEPAGDMERNLVEAAWACSLAGLKAARSGGMVSDISHSVAEKAAQLGCRVLTQLCGHGIGRAIHEDPLIRYDGARIGGTPLVPGMVLTIEPVLSFGSGQVELMEDGFGYVTCDGAPTAQFEHMVALRGDHTQLLSYPLGSYGDFGSNENLDSRWWRGGTEEARRAIEEWRIST